ncbi:MAG: hypothetical protein PHY99_07405 [Bacteroidales bacterium]|nr:hypothetical protein [Bacteroidales bacterium]
MKSKLFAVFAVCSFLSACEEYPDICLERKPIPIIYSVFNKYDSVNYLYITKTWSGDNGGSLVTAKNADSLYYKDVKVCMDLIRTPESGTATSDDTLCVIPDLEQIQHKEPGIFMNSGCPVYALHHNLNEVNAVISHISIPGYETIDLSYQLLERPVFEFPNRDGATILVLPDKPLKIRVNGRGDRRELWIYFEIITQTSQGIKSDTVLVYNLNDFTSQMGYGNLTSALNLQLKVDPDVEYRKFGKVRLVIWSGNGKFPYGNYQLVSTSKIDYTVPSSPWVPALMVYGGVIVTNQLNDLILDQRTCAAIASDTSLTKFKFVKW